MVRHGNLVVFRRRGLGIPEADDSLVRVDDFDLPGVSRRAGRANLIAAGQIGAMLYEIDHDLL